MQGEYTEPDGTYRVRGLAPGGGYSVCFNASEGPGGFISECYDNKAIDTPAPTLVTVTANATRTGVNAALDPVP